MVEPIKTVLMRRDGISEEEAQQIIDDTKEELEELLDRGGSLDEAEEIVKDNLGLEPDYLDELIF